jgi:fructokinase
MESTRFGGSFGVSEVWTTMPEVITLGELLIDFVPTVSGVSLIEAPAFQKAPGGAPANVAVGLAKLGVSSGFMGKVGEDAFGHFLAQTLVQAGVDVSALCFAAEARTALAFVSLKADGERDFMFYRHPSADMLYRPDELDEGYIRSAKIFHFGSISLISDPSRATTLKAIEIARSGGLLVSYDPNLRLNLWSSAEGARQGILEAWPLAQVIKISEDELSFLSGKDEISAGAHSLWHDRLRLLVITRGRTGCTYFTPDLKGDVSGYPVQAVDTTGAGDGFVAGLLKGLVENMDHALDEPRLIAICRYANAVGALTTTQRGAIPALPTLQEVDHFLEISGQSPA